MKELFTIDRAGIYIPEADTYIDPWRPVDRAVITHGHSDHARSGHKQYLCHPLTAPVLKARLGDHKIYTFQYGEVFTINGVRFSLHPAGHIPGSAQVRVEYKGQVLVVSGDYKTQADGLSTPFEPVQCHTFITESTFGLPVYRWQEEADIKKNLLAWWEYNKTGGKNAVVFAYSLGKAQRVLQMAGMEDKPVLVHGAVANMNKALEKGGIKLHPWTAVQTGGGKLKDTGRLVIAPPSAAGSNWMKRFEPYSTAFASGWMQVRGHKCRRAMDKGIVMSDHADWTGLLEAVKASGAEKVYATHGYTAAFVRYLQESGIDAAELPTAFTGETIDQTKEDEE